MARGRRAARRRAWHDQLRYADELRDPADFFEDVPGDKPDKEMVAPENNFPAAHKPRRMQFDHVAPRRILDYSQQVLSLGAELHDAHLLGCI